MAGIEDMYLELWRRVDYVVAHLTASGDASTADYLMVGFFLRYPEPDELRRFVELAEESVKPR